MGILAAIALVTLAVVVPARGEEQTREGYVAQIEPICKANRAANERIMAGARSHVNKDQFEAVGKQFVRVSRSFGGLVGQIAAVPPAPADEPRVERWLSVMRLLKTRLLTVGKLYKEGEDIKAAHESILAERSGITANNISIAFHVHYCRFGRFDRG